MKVNFETGIKIKKHYQSLLVNEKFNFNNKECVIIELMVIPNDASEIKRGGHNMPDAYFSGNNGGVYVCWSGLNYSPIVSTLEEICESIGMSLEFVNSFKD